MRRRPHPAEPLADGAEPLRPVADGVAGAHTVEASPSMAQYLEIKAANPDSLLWYRMGDFYELFFEDAVTASQALGIVLTKRGRHIGQDIPMCGVPVHRADDYLQRLIKQGYRVAVCEQLEDPAEARKRGSKAVVRRDVVRLVTPGTLTEDSLLDARARNYLTALFAVPQRTVDAPAEFALASLDISTGEFEIGVIGRADLPGELVRLGASEVVAADATLADSEVRRWLTVVGAAATPVPAASFDSLSGERTLKARLEIADLAAFGAFTRPELAAAAALLKYVELTQIGRQPALRPPRQTGPGSILVIDAASRASLELVKSTSGGKDGSLLAAIDRTLTGPGARELAARLQSPLRDADLVNARLDAVGYLLDRESLRESLRSTLRQAPDIARAISRLALQRGGPRDLAAIRLGLAAAGRAKDLLLRHSERALGLPAELGALVERLGGVDPALHGELARAIVEDPPPVRRDGGFVRSGYRGELDDARRLSEDSRKVIAGFEAKYAEQTGVKSLKIRHNNILGYYIETTAANAKPLLDPPLADMFRHRQTMANAVRFTTVELVEIEGRISSAGARALAIEQEVFAELSRAVEAQTGGLGALAAALAEIDHYGGLAELAADEGYVRPVVDDSTAFDVKGGRHPVVEQALKATKAHAFIDNDCVLAGPVPAMSAGGVPEGFEESISGRLWLVTGPNMAGKSTFLRQNALMVLLAQMGSYVPARSAHIGVVDRLFSRVGAADDLARGRSTFMVEMVETAGILNQATGRSLVILDEIGRGTATFDGLSIAWATVEHLHDVNRCRTLFATHYHELTALAGRLAEVVNVTMDVKEWHDEIVFLHKLRPGAADRSYGIQVAKLAGLPPAVLKRARDVLSRLEKDDRRLVRAGKLEDLPLFAATASDAQAQPDRGPTALEAAVDEARPDDLSPRAALDLIYRLKGMRAEAKARRGRHERDD